MVYIWYGSPIKLDRPPSYQTHELWFRHVCGTLWLVLSKSEGLPKNPAFQAQWTLRVQWYITVLGLSPTRKSGSFTTGPYCHYKKWFAEVLVLNNTWVSLDHLHDPSPTHCLKVIMVVGWSLVLQEHLRLPRIIFNQATGTRHQSSSLWTILHMVEPIRPHG